VAEVEVDIQEAVVQEVQQVLVVAVQVVDQAILVLDLMEQLILAEAEAEQVFQALMYLEAMVVQA